MAPTTMPGQVATTCQMGRDVASAGHPIRVAELISTLRTPAFVARASSHTPLAAVHAKEMLRRAFRYQVDGRCFSLVEILSTCPTNWGIPPADATRWLEQNMIPYYPLGVFKTPDGEDRAPLPRRA
jgi:2-oxoglutarate ferredoxin oxidoreductase subunit beta